jgi:hypothetical protein
MHSIVILEVEVWKARAAVPVANEYQQDEVSSKQRLDEHRKSLSNDVRKK